MKNVKRYLSAILMFALAGPFFTACDNGLEDYSSRTTFSMPSDMYNAKIQYVTRLSDGKLAASDADFTAIDNYLVTTLEGKKKSWLTVLDRVDGNNQPKVLQTALNTKRWTAFAFNRIVNKTGYEGSVLYFNSPTNEVKGTPSGAGCFVTTLAVKMAGTRTDKDNAGSIKSTTDISFGIYFNTARFENSGQVDAFLGSALGQIYYDHMNFLMIGTVKNDLFDKLQSGASGAGDFVVTRVKQGAAYSIFMLSEVRFWGFTGVTSESLGNGIESHTVNVMW